MKRKREDATNNTNDKRNKASDVSISCLNTESLLQIFSYLNPKELVKISEVNHQWNDLAKSDLLWQAHRLRTFPNTLLNAKDTEHPSEWAYFIAEHRNVKQNLKRENVNDEFHSEDQCLTELECIRDDDFGNEHDKSQSYIELSARGSSAAFLQLDPQEKVEAVIKTIKANNLDHFILLFSQVVNNLDEHQYSSIVNAAVKENNLKVLAYLMESNKDLNENAIKALKTWITIAANKGHLELMQYLLETANNKVPVFLLSLRASIDEMGQKLVEKYGILQPGARPTAEHAKEMNELHSLLQHCMSTAQKYHPVTLQGCALKGAAEGGSLNIVKYLVEQVTISNEDKAEAQRYAILHERHDVVEYFNALLCTNRSRMNP